MAVVKTQIVVNRWMCSYHGVYISREHRPTFHSSSIVYMCTYTSFAIFSQFLFRCPVAIFFLFPVKIHTNVN